VSAADAQRLASLLAACARRDERAFRELYEASAPKLFGTALRILKREDWAEEVLQDCYVSIWTNARTYSPALAAPLTWMTSIVRNRCLDWMRRPRMEVQAPAEAEDEDFFDRFADPSPGPLERLHQSQDAVALARCLGTLEGKQRRAVLLAFFDGLTHAELAERLSEPLGTVKTWVRRGLMRLKACLDGTSPETTDAR